MNEIEKTEARALIRTQEGSPGGYGYVLFEGVLSKTSDGTSLYVVAYEDGNIFWVSDEDWVVCSSPCSRIREEFYKHAKLEELDWALWNWTGYDFYYCKVQEVEHDND